MKRVYQLKLVVRAQEVPSPQSRRSSLWVKVSSQLETLAAPREITSVEITVSPVPSPTTSFSLCSCVLNIGPHDCAGPALTQRKRKRSEECELVVVQVSSLLREGLFESMHSFLNE